MHRKLWIIVEINVYIECIIIIFIFKSMPLTMAHYVCVSWVMGVGGAGGKRSELEGGLQVHSG